MKSNGCGPAFLPKFLKNLLFNWWFEPLCNEHDQAYQRGGYHRDRQLADDIFLEGMLLSIVYLKSWQKPLAVCQAVVFYLAVRFFGWLYFNYHK